MAERFDLAPAQMLTGVESPVRSAFPDMRASISNPRAPRNQT